MQNLVSLQRLKRDKTIEKVFAEGKSIFIHPIKLVYIRSVPQHDDTDSIYAGVTVSKRNFKRAVDRNRVKRLLREAMRLHAHYLPTGANLYIMSIYISKELPDFETIDRTIKRLFKKIK